MVTVSVDRGDVLTGWSTALAVLSVCVIVLALHRLYCEWDRFDWRNRSIVLGIVFAGVMGVIHQGDQAWLWMHDAYSAASLRWTTWAYRGSGTAMIMLLGGGIAYPRCGHLGWIGMVLGGVLAGAIAVMVSP